MFVIPCLCVYVHVWRSGRTLIWEFILFFHYVSPWHWTQVGKLDSKLISPLSVSLAFFLFVHSFSCIHLFIFFSTGAKNQSLMSVSKIMFWTWRDGSGIKRKFAALSENPSLAPSTHLKWLETPALKYPVPSSGFTQMNIHSSIDILTHAHTEMQITNHEGSHYLYIIGDIMVTPYSCSARSYHSMAVGRLLPLLKW